MSSWLRIAGASPGVQVWRIDNASQQITSESKNHHGIFKTEDCYIVLETKVDFKVGTEKQFNIYYWVGSASQQEAFTLGTAKELVGKLERPHGPTKELQEAESAEFKSLFNINLQYVKSSTLQTQVNVKDESHTTKLYHIKGKKDIRVKQVPVSYRSMNTGDVYILDCDNVLYQWIGKKCNRMEKGKPLDLTTRMRDERMNRFKARVVQLEEDEETTEFWAALGGKGPISQITEDDEEWERKPFMDHHIYRFNVGSRPTDYTVEEIPTDDAPFATSLIDPAFTYIFDFNLAMFVWYGRSSAFRSKANGIAEAKKIAKQSGRSENIEVTTVEQGVEPSILKSRFKGYWTWTTAGSTSVSNPTPATKDVKKEPVDFVNVDQMHHPEKYLIAREQQRNLVPKSDIEHVREREFSIWYINENEKYELPQEEYGIFFSGNSYIVLFSVTLDNYEKIHVIYFWQGRDSTVDDQGTAALLATDMAQSAKRRGAHLIRVPQGHETVDLLSHFLGYASIREGNRDTWSKENEHKSCLYHVRGFSKYNTFGVQVEAASFSLNSGDCFTLFTPSRVFMWFGRGGNDFERDYCKVMSNKYARGRRVEAVEEGREPDEFWRALGGKSKHCDNCTVGTGDLKSKFFYCTDKTGPFVVTQLTDYSQDSMEARSVIILDVYYCVFLWISSEASERATKRGKSLVREYVRTLEGRKTCPVYLVEEGKEPVDFTVYFHGWHYNDTAKV
eukprot:TRINITY_DN1671_c0_g1_i1.p1 TRINITY_DN1671_c0_g1~~TRINITY_DN1671_c0_g1_i1.p1  ORF type:complete len:730 (-),score=131.86 TRINITY_DN1671_c0_g1_i1:633-2822(-)